MTSSTLTRSKVIALAVPVMLAQAATASTGVVDTAVMGLTGDKVELGAVGVAAVAMNFLYWAFGFLRMSTTGLTAQANGASDIAEVNALLQRALLVGGGMGIVAENTYGMTLGNAVDLRVGIRSTTSLGAQDTKKYDLGTVSWLDGVLALGFNL